MEKQRQQELAELKPTAEMMDEEQFWTIVQAAVDEAGDDEDEYLEVVKRELSKLSLKEMVGLGFAPTSFFMIVTTLRCVAPRI